MEREYFVTDDTALAAFLHMNGFEFIEATLTNRNNPSRKKFIMIDRGDREKLERVYFDREPIMMSPLDYHDSRVRISRYLKVTITDPRKPDTDMVN